MRKWIFALLAATLAISVVTLTPIGPLFVYGTLVPIIDPLIPRPAGVPSRAEAEYHWKGFGLIWIWDDPVEGGCARWMAAQGSGDPVRTLDVFEGQKGCGEGMTTMHRMSFMDATTYGAQPNAPPYQECPFTLSEDTVKKYKNQIQDLQNINSGEIEQKMLDAMRSELEQIKVMDLSAQQYGCRADDGRLVSE